MNKYKFIKVYIQSLLFVRFSWDRVQKIDLRKVLANISKSGLSCRVLMQQVSLAISLTC